MKAVSKNIIAITNTKFIKNLAFAKFYFLQKMLKFDKKNFSLIFQLKGFQNHFSKKTCLKPKKEFHITIIGYKTWEKIKKLANKKRIFELEKLIKNFDFEYKLLDEYFLIQKNDRKSIIQKIDSNIENFYKKLNDIFPADFSVPFEHITLFWEWIGLYSQKDFDKYLIEKL